MRKMLFTVFRDKGINAESKWDRVLEDLDHDERFLLVKNIKDRKKVFKEFVNQEKDKYKRYLLDKKLNAKKNFKKMIEDYGYITTETKFQSLIPIFNTDPRWQTLDDKEKEEAFEEYLEEIFIRENEKEKEMVKLKCDKLKRQMLEIKNVTPSTKWEDIKRIMEYNSLWNELHDYHRLKTFSEFISNLREAEDKQKIKEREKVERRHKLRFRDFLESEMKVDAVTCKTLWSTYVKKIQDEESLYNLIGQEVSNPRDIFLDYKVQLAAMQKKSKETFRKLFKERLDLYPVGIDLEEFKEQLKTHQFFKGLEHERVSNSLNYYAKYLHKKLVKRHQKAVGKLVKFFYKEKVTPATSLEKLEPEMKDHKDAKYLGSLCDEDKEKYLGIYKGYLDNKSKLVDFVRSMNGKKIGNRKSKSRSKDRSESPEVRKRKDKRKRKDRSSSVRRSEDMEQGEIKPANLKRIKPYKKRSNSGSDN